MNDSDASEIAVRLAAVRQRIASACTASGRDPAAVTLVAVSKRKPVELIRAAYAAGQRVFGENYAQELQSKARQLADLPDIRWHFIGALQRNKAKLVVGDAALLHSVTSESLVAALNSRALNRGLVQDVLIQLNLSAEPTKAGVEEAELPALLDACSKASNVRCAGLMTMPPPTDDPRDNAPYFARLRQLRDDLESGQQLSMGMSGDFEAAIAEGATLVRVGTAIFGAR